MRVLLDTNVVSELIRKGGSKRVVERVRALGDTAHLSVITIGEMHKGIARLSPGPKRTLLTDFIERAEHEYRQRILPVDVATARLWGELTARAARRKRTLPAADGLIAATALHHGLPVMTRNVKDFVNIGVRLVNCERPAYVTAVRSAEVIALRSAELIALRSAELIALRSAALIAARSAELIATPR